MRQQRLLKSGADAHGRTGVDDAHAGSGAAHGADIPAQGGGREAEARDGEDAARAVNEGFAQRLRAAKPKAEPDPPEWVTLEERVKKLAGADPSTFRILTELKAWARDGHSGMTEMGITTPLDRIKAMAEGYEFYAGKGKFSPMAKWIVEKGCEARAKAKEAAPKMRTLEARAPVRRNNTSADAFKMMEL